MKHFLALAALALAFSTVQSRADPYAAAAPGLVEPLGEERQIASQVIGIIDKVLVEENDAVAANQPIAIIVNGEQAARVAATRAQLAEAQAQLEKLLNGARPEERREAKALLEQLDAELQLAQLDYDRKKPLRASGAASQAALDQSSSALGSLKMRRTAMAERVAVIEAGARVEDIAAARAVVERLKAETTFAEAQLEKFTIRSPIAGTLLRRQRNAGEAVTNIDPTPIAIVGDLSRLRVRAEVDETDIGRIAVGQRVEVTADAYPGKKFGGTVARIAQRLGAKAVQTGRPSEKVDMKVLQAMIDLDPEVRLPVGLRIDVGFVAPQAARR
ncbi:HlyD family efflux transporter periplasmic adaptor subunit [Rhodoblastus acidophilus]|uniref:HlyD family efflux transporter periplasmic adaptor subunit n=1 Tax=Rhodoblastus acidophilus TaxID=1074 RepID=A0A6N8DHK4_RHOAC|nr:efflux RND transporter periplasmic adaptor subunit [Rhodoblastus acidophilus]MCW2272990.1 HlyD family secretion protein [Rhodoblastus acidophilus]MTV29892.1 HlyD family efflux transporter periplasmic adaptor subunit [Rhodoblastus acidophilus]